MILAATFHYEFVAIHPFDDGNGRMARLLMNLILMQAGYPPVVARIDGRPEYYLALAQADAGELDNFITLIGNLLIHSLELFLRGAKGENVDELSDLDKKLALLQKQLELEDSFSGPEKNLETHRKVYINIFLHLFFRKYGFEIEYALGGRKGDPTMFISDRYDSKYPEVEIQEFVKHVTDEIYKVIEAKTNNKIC